MGKEDPVTVRHASEADKAFWLSLDRHLPEGAFERKLASRHPTTSTAANSARARGLFSTMGTLCSFAISLIFCATKS